MAATCLLLKYHSGKFGRAGESNYHQQGEGRECEKEAGQMQHFYCDSKGRSCYNGYDA